MPSSKAFSEGDTRQRSKNLTEGKGDSIVASQIRENSRKVAKPREEVENDIARRSFGEIESDDSVETSEKIE